MADAAFLGYETPTPRRSGVGYRETGVGHNAHTVQGEAADSTCVEPGRRGHLRRRVSEQPRLTKVGRRLV